MTALNRLILIGALSALLGLVSDRPASAEIGQRVLWVDGQVSSKSLTPRGPRALELQPTDRIIERTKVTVPVNGALWLLDRGRTLLGLKGPGTWEVSPQGELRGDGEVVQLDLSSLALDAPPSMSWIELARPPQSRTLLRCISPVETSVTTQRPVLRWRAEPGVLRTDLTLSRRDAEGRTELVETWRGLTGNHHEVSRPLEAGYDYRWQLVVGDRPLPKAEDERSRQAHAWFHVLSPDAIRDVRASDRKISTWQLGTPEAVKALEVIRALMWEHHGLSTEARAAWDEIIGELGDLEAVRMHRARLELRALEAPRRPSKRPNSARQGAQDVP